MQNIPEECIELNKRPHRRPPRKQSNRIPPKPPPQILFCSFVLWTATSLTASIIITSGFWLPYWIQGSYHQVIDVSFGSFRRCNYPQLDENGRIQIIPKCGRYKTFADIPSLSWKITTILVGLGASLMILVSFILLFSCCMPYSVTPANSRRLVLLQLFASFLITSGCLIYPLGWNNQEIRDACGINMIPYQIGDCQLSLSAYLLSIGLLLIILCLLFGCYTIRKLRKIKSDSYENVII